MATPPDEVRASLALVTSAVAAEVATVGAGTASLDEAREILLVATPLIVARYSDGSSALALDWYEELRGEADVSRTYEPSPAETASEALVQGAVAAALTPTPDSPHAPLQLVADAITELVTDAFRSTITENVARDPEAVGWRRFARPGACKFCRMLAAKGAVYKTEKTARFAAHGAVMAGGRKGGNCMCIAGPAFGSHGSWVEATPVQYMASRKKRTPEQRARLREYLNEHFPDAPG